MTRNRAQAVVPRQPRAASALTNGTRMWPRSVDMRSAWGRRLRDVFIAQVLDLGGIDACSAAQLSIARRVATLTVELEKLEQGFSREPATVDALDLYGRLSNTLKRHLETLGLERRARKLTAGE